MTNGKRTSTPRAAKAAAIGAGIAAVAAGVYFFLGPNGKKHQQKFKGWMVKMKGEVIEKLEEVKDVTEPMYNKIVDTVAAAYTAQKNIPKAEIVALVSELKREWKNISKTVSGKSSRKHTTNKRKSKNK